MEPEQLPLQVALLTMEVATLRERLTLLAAAMGQAAEAATLPAGDLMARPDDWQLGPDPLDVP